MADDLSPVQPGDLITAALLNKIIARLQGVAVATGTSVPNLFGMTLGQASALLRTTASGLQLGGVLDVFGTAITPTDPSKVPLLVVGQSPSAGVLVTSGSAVNLVIAGPSATSVPKTPTITSTIPATQNVGLGLEIVGTNFDTLPANNTVTINGVQTPAPATNSTSQNLFVTVPPGADAAPQPTTVKVTTVSGGPSNPFNVTIQASTGVQQATITSFGGAAVKVTGTVAVVTTNPSTGADITVTGANFGTDGTKVKLFLGNPNSTGTPALTPTAGTTVTATSMTIHVPPASTLGSFTTSAPVVQVNGVNGVASTTTLLIT